MSRSVMNKDFRLNSGRLVLRQWLSSDYPGFASMNADPKVMEYFPELLSVDESNAAAQKYEARIAQCGWGFWATELVETGEFIGVVGLAPVTDLPIGECVEVGWRLSSKHWGKGYATEAGLAALEFAFGQLQLVQVVSITSVINSRSRVVMQRLGLTNTNQNFQHPRIAEENKLREHVLYKISKSQFDFQNQNHQLGENGK